MSKSNVQAIEGSNVDPLLAIIVQCAKEMAEIDSKRKVLNREAADIREVVKDKGIQVDAFRDVYSYYKKQRHEKDGYDESHKLCHDALNDADTLNMFDFNQEE